MFPSETYTLALDGKTEYITSHDHILATEGQIIFTDGHRIGAILRVHLAVDTKICGVTLIQILLLVYKTMDIFSCVLFSLGLSSSMKTKIKVGTK